MFKGKTGLKMAVKEILKGSYCLIIHLKEISVIRPGKLEKINLESGYYVYVGSALNSLEGRLDRHLRKSKKLFWHIDYLLDNKNSEIINIIYTISDLKWECEIASSIAENGIKINKFGCSDCKCDSHLFYFKILQDAIETCQNTYKELDLKLENFRA